MAVARPGQDHWAAAAGFSDRERRKPLNVGDRFRIASVTKTFTAVVALQLAEEGRLRLDDPVTLHVASFPWGDHVTVRHLLAHTSGIPDYWRVNNFLHQLLQRRDKRWTAEEVVGLVASRPLEFTPGARFSYSNTNYKVLGQVIDRAAGASWASEVRRRVLEPLEMRDTFIPSVEAVPGGVIAGYFDADRDGDTENAGGGSWPALETEGEADGNIVSTVADLLRFDLALFRGQLLKRRSMDAIMADAGDYTLGVQRWEAHVGVPAVGHSGSDPGFAGTMAYLPDQDVGIVVLTNDSGADPTDLVAVAARHVVRRRA
jgi:D-alanyl-D-alanine carboxypeptidase